MKLATSIILRYIFSTPGKPSMPCSNSMPEGSFPEWPLVEVHPNHLQDSPPPEAQQSPVDAMQIILSQ